VFRALFSPDGKIVLTSSSDGTARLWNARPDQQARHFVGHTGQIEGVAWSPDGTELLTASGDGLRLWNAMTYQELQQFSAYGDGVLSPDGREVLARQLDGYLSLWDTQTGQELRRFIGADGGGLYRPVFSHNGEFVLAGTDFGNLLMWDVATSQQVQ